MTDLPKPVLALIGVLAEARNLPAHAVSAGVTVLGLTYKAREDYTKLVARGEQALADVLGGGEAPDQAWALPPDPPAAEPVAVTPPPAAPEPAAASGPEPLPGYDGMSLGALRGRLRALSEDQLREVLAYERSHLARQPMITLVESRLARLGAE